MATFTAGPAETGVQPKATRVGLTAVKASLSLDGVSTSIGHVFRMLKIPAHSKIVNLVVWPNLSGNLTLQVGDSVNGERFKSTGTFSAGDGNITPTVQQIAYSYSADDTLLVKISLVSASTLGGAVHAQVIFSMDA